MSTVIMGFAALTVDMGAMYNTKADLQRTVDAAALAAASRLSAYSEGDPQALAKAQAELYVGANSVFGKQLQLGEGDVEFGTAVYDENSGQFEFQPTNDFPDAVRVRLRMTEDSPNGEMPLYFARVLGRDKTQVEAEAIAMIIPRDIAIVADLSGSHNDDSELRNYKNTSINLHEVWSGIPGGISDENSVWNGDEFAGDESGYSPQMAGPAWGFFKHLGWGEQNLEPSYSPNSDSGLIKLTYNQNWSNAQLQGYLQAQGYSSAEVNAIMSGSNDSSGYWDERVAVALGLARWDSGIPGGLWEQVGVSPSQAGNGNTIIGSGEIVWQETFGNRSINASRDIWLDYINNYARSTSNAMYSANSNFRYQFGAKTFVNYLLERRPSNSQTPELANTQTQPMQAVKDAVGHLASVLEGMETDDLLSLEVYGTTAKHEVNLTTDYAGVAAHLAAMQASHYDSYTNLGGGIEKGIQELTGSRSRTIARKFMFLLTDGIANVTASGQVNNESGGKSYALAAAQSAVNQGIRIYTISVGSGADTALMSQIATLGKGIHLHAEGSIEEYSAQLEAIFKTLGGSRPVELIK